MGKKMKTMDANSAAAYVSYAFTDVAAVYPITPSSPMAEEVDVMAAGGVKNLFGQRVKVVEMQSEAGAAGAVHGSLAAGALTTTYTASQGLLLMIPNMYKIAGELLPAVFHVTARAVATHALCIFGDHSDVMATRQTGFALLCAGSVQEAMDLAAVAHLSAIGGRVPFLHFFDGFRTSHEIQKIEVIDYDDLGRLMDWEALEEFKRRGLNPQNPVIRGTAQNPDIFFQAREAAQPFYDRLPEVTSHYMEQISQLTGRKYHLFDYTGSPDADRVIIAMGSVCGTIEETIRVLQERGEKVGLVRVRLYRPWAPQYLKAVIPRSARRLAVLDRTKEPGALGEPLYMDVKAMYCGEENAPEIYGGRYGLGSKDTTPGQIAAVFENLRQRKPKDHFTIGITDDVSQSSLNTIDMSFEPENAMSCKFWGLGSDGTVGANKQAIKIIGDHTELYVQGYFSYDSKKSGGLTVSHLRFGKQRILSSYLIERADFVACHNQSYVYRYDLLKGIKPGGCFLLNCSWNDSQLKTKLPASMRKELLKKNIRFYTIDAVNIAQKLGLGNRINMIMQAAFFRLNNVMDLKEATNCLKQSIEATYAKKGEEVVKRNWEAVDQGIKGLHEVKLSLDWEEEDSLAFENGGEERLPDFIENILIPMNRQEGDCLPVSAFSGREDGTFPLGTAAYEKRGAAVMLPQWQEENCIQCNQCSFVCPHAAIRPVLLTQKEAKEAPGGFVTLEARGLEGKESYRYRIQVSPLDCLGCGSCADVCPAPHKALVMKPFGEENKKGHWEYAVSLPLKENPAKKDTVRGSQFYKPYLEFSGACAGCGETLYIKVATQLFGDRMMIANATGCSSIWGASAPSMPYTKDSRGRGPAWANSLFEDNAEYGLGMAVAVRQMREKLQEDMENFMALDCCEEAETACKEWISGRDEGIKTWERAQAVIQALEGCLLTEKERQAAEEILKRRDFLVKRSVWCLGGDGWAYDIGYGGVDHVLASGEDINLMVFDTEVYSNTGGQSSKATPASAVARLSASGKKTKKKDLGMMAMSYGYVYVAQVAMGADKNQFMKALKEAEDYHGPSLIICYAPCINHGLKQGMGKAQQSMKDAVDCGYWHLYRFNPSNKKQGKPLFTLDSKEPKEDFREFLMNQIRFSSLKKEFPQGAEELFEKAKKDARERLESYRRLSQGEMAAQEKKKG